MGCGEAVESSGLRTPTAHLYLLGACYRARVPVTVRVALGTDVLRIHPSADSGAIGRASSCTISACSARLSSPGSTAGAFCERWLRSRSPSGGLPEGPSRPCAASALPLRGFRTSEPAISSSAPTTDERHPHPWGTGPDSRSSDTQSSYAGSDQSPVPGLQGGAAPPG